MVFLKISFRLQFILPLLLLACLAGCKEDHPNTRPEELSEKELIAEDYIEPGIKWGYINKNGEIAIDEQFDDCRDFAQHRAAASKKGLWGYIDTQGEWILEPLFRGTWSFKDGRGRIKVLDGNFGFVDSTGSLVVDTIWDWAEDYHEGIAMVKKNNRYQFINQHGKLISEDSWEQAFAFKNGFARISNGGWWGLLDTSGVIVIKPMYDDIGEFYFNRIATNVKGHWGFIDTGDHMMVEPIYDEVTPFQHDIAGVKKGNTWSLIDQSGQKLNDIDGSDVMALGSDRWSVFKNDSFAMFDLRGKRLTPFQYTQINMFSNSLACFIKDNLTGYLDTMGHHRIANIFLLGWDFNNETARYSLGEGIGFINPSGKAIYEAVFPDVRDYSEGLAKVQTVHR
ncbi:MAG: WG repeat-containing protein [Saprospiraceae bacterium]